ncbi:MAG: peroxiredoxin family protein [Planctomycetaceae bacterium]
MFIDLGMAFPWLLIGVGAWLGYQFVRQNGRILLRLESIDKCLAARASPPQPKPEGLPVGSMAPDFALPDLTGVRRKLSEFRGREVLLIFFNPQCGYCTQMAPDLAAMPPEGSDTRPVPIVVTTGDAEENRRLVAQHGIRGVVLLQDKMEVASLFRAQGTPMGYRIDAVGRIASELAVGAEPLLRLATSAVPYQYAAGATENGAVPHGKQDDPSLARSRLNRKGLKTGEAAPDFRLPCIDGGELALADFRGRRVLLVFSDPDCGPCDELAPRLQELHVQRPDLQVLVVSRHEVEVNRLKAAKLGLSFPIVLQKQWEISLKYAMFATPIGYLIDEQGVLLSNVAVGVDPILALTGEPPHESQNESESQHAGKEHLMSV